MTVWFTSDQHWGHANIIKFAKRPFSCPREMDRHLVRKWNEVVKPGDRVYSLGDTSFNHTNFLEGLPGEKFLIKGNHDKKRVTSSPAWVQVSDYKEIKIEGQAIVLCHYAFETWRGSHRGNWHLHGHSHGNLPPRGKRMDVGVDCHPDYGLFSFEDIKEIMSQRKFEAVDHHKEKA